MMIQNGTGSLQAYIPSSGAFNFIAPLPSGVNLCGGCSAVIRTTPNQYIFQAAYTIIGFDIASGNLIYNTPILDLPNESFGHMELKCGSDLLYGTSANPTAGIKYLSTVDLYRYRCTCRTKWMDTGCIQTIQWRKLYKSGYRRIFLFRSWASID